MSPKKANYSFSFKDYALVIIVLISLNCGFISISIWMSQQDIESDFSHYSQTVHNTLLHRLDNIDAALVSLAGINHSLLDNSNYDSASLAQDILANFDFVDAVYTSDKKASTETNSPPLYPITSVTPHLTETTQLIGTDFNQNAQYTTEISKSISKGTIVHTKPGNKLYKSDILYFLIKAIYSGYFKPASEASRNSQAHSLAIIQINIKKLIPSFKTLHGDYNISIDEKHANFISIQSEKESITPFWNPQPLRFITKINVHDNSFELNTYKNLSIEDFINKHLLTATFLSFSISLAFIFLLLSLRRSQRRQ